MWPASLAALCLVGLAQASASLAWSPVIQRHIAECSVLRRTGNHAATINSTCVHRMASATTPA